MIALARIVLRSLVDPAGLVVPSATPLTRRRIGERLEVRAGLVPGGLRHEYRLVPASARSSNCGAQGFIDEKSLPPEVQEHIASMVEFFRELEQSA